MPALQKIHLKEVVEMMKVAKVQNASSSKIRAVAVSLVFIKRDTLLGDVAYGSMRGNRHTRIPDVILEKVGLKGLKFLQFPQFASIKGDEELNIIAALQTAPTQDTQPFEQFEWVRISPPLIALNPPEGVNVHRQYGGTLIAFLKGLPQKVERVKQGKIYFIPDLTS